MSEQKRDFPEIKNSEIRAQVAASLAAASCALIATGIEPETANRIAQRQFQARIAFLQDEVWPPEPRRLSEGSDLTWRFPVIESGLTAIR